MMDELLRLTKENNEMLRRIVAYIDKVESKAYQEREDMRNMAINLAADSIIEVLGNRRNNGNFNDQIFYR